MDRIFLNQLYRSSARVPLCLPAGAANKKNNLSAFVSLWQMKKNNLSAFVSSWQTNYLKF
jgi:hypothetical protein